MRKGMKKALALLLGTAMTVGMLAGCGSSEEPATSGSVAESNVASSDANAGTSDATGIDLSEHVDLTMYLVGDVPDGVDEVYAKVNEVLEEKLNCSLNVEWLSWSEHKDKYPLLFAGGEDFDMIFTATSWCHYESTVGLNGFLELTDELISTYAPDIKATLPQVAWDQATLDGSVYMLPANYVEVTPDVVAIRGDLMAKYGYEDIASYDELISFYKDCAADGVYGNAVGAGSVYWLWFQSLGHTIVSGAPNNGQLVLFNTQDATDTSVKYILDWEEFDAYCHQMKELADAGCWPSDVLSTTSDRQDGLLSGRGASMVWNAGSCQTYANQANAENPDWNINIYNINPDIKYTGTKYINGGIGINAASENPERAIMVANELATNPELHELTHLGIEGVNWEAVGDDQYKVIEGAAYNASNFWGWRNGDLMRKQAKDNPTAVDAKVDELNEYFLANVKAEHPLDGFAFDSSTVSAQYAAVETVMGMYFDPLVNGLVSDVDESLAKFRKDLEAAGVNDVLAEMQSQLDAYLASK